ncbi:glutathione peroxidase [Pelistega indica]|uniref:Glutathione peroxidase n=2 Tax=Alcaligenaceae TaxID=506 RepID=V8G6J9_9BURK|nr:MULTISPECIES: glutathione peroxidase [Pelistega]ETD71711.1 glutathione peroxidase [Pelistega indica]
MDTDFYSFNAQTIDNQSFNFEQLKGKVVLIVNTASQCGFTPQYKELEKLYQTFRNQNFMILAFPCNQFGHQEPGDAVEIKHFCELNYGVTFTLMAKVDVNGDNAHPLFTWLKKQKSGIMGEHIKWNFTKFLVNKNGLVIGRYAPLTKPSNLSKDIQQAILNE